MDAEGSLAVLRGARGLLDGFWDGSDEGTEEAFRAWAEEKDVKLGQVLQPFRVAVTGSRVSPPLFPSLRLLGREKTEKRIAGLIGRLEDTI